MDRERLVKHVATKIERGKYEYRGRIIYLISLRKNLFKPWRVSTGHLAGVRVTVGGAFSTMQEAKRFVDQEMDESGAE